MAQKHHLIEWDAVMRGFDNLTFQHVNDAGRLTRYGVVSILARAAVILIGSVIIGGIILSAANSFVAGLFGVPEFGELRSMGFTMAAAVGLGLATWFLIHNLRHPTGSD